ncbi:hypothetical protein FJT64_006766 [Amphibalanus amphitrite]|uniref:Uncharacterized protein n=1 Tax=Amphibalanus amphitrite TaxID=1232801 RepID=A0A6A4VM80_AMPAM|nr:hypothetical protein FJT64_006766 [Amphibalanus amphitrite]
MKPASGGAGYYLNVPGAPREPPPTAGLDLCNRDQRGSAFELYRKPDNARYLSSDGARPVGLEGLLDQLLEYLVDR